MDKIKFSASRAGIVAVILWALSSFVSITPLIAVLFLVLVAIAGFWRRSRGIQIMGEVGGGTIKWGWSDYLGIALLIVVITAVVKGVNPLDILKLFPSLK
jgi:hypothetical protein